MKLRFPIKRRWLRLSVRGLLLLVLVLCAALAYWSHRARLQEELVRRLVKDGRGVVAYHHELDANGKGVPDAKPPGPEWLRNLIGDHTFTRLYAVGTYRATEDDLRLISEFPSIEKLSLDYGLRDEGMKYIVPLRNLKRLELDSPHITDRGMENLSGLRNLEELVVMHSRITDQGLKHLGDLQNLKLLLIDQTQVTAEGIALLRKRVPSVNIPVDGYASAPEEREAVQKLIQNGGVFSADKDGWITDVTFYGKDVGDEQLAVLSSFKRLRDLGCYDTRVTFAGVQPLLQKNPKLKVFPQFQQPLPGEAEAIAALNRMGARLVFNDHGHVNTVESFDEEFSEETLSHIAELDQLTLLSLPYAAKVDCRFLAHMQSLEVLTLDELELTDADVKHLGGLKNLKRLRLNGTNLSDDGLAILAELPSLDRLEVRHVAFTGRGIARLTQVSELSLTFRSPGTFSDDDLSLVANLTKLKKLSLFFTNVTDDGLPHLKKLVNLQTLSLPNSMVTDDGLMWLQKLPNLKSLHLKDTQVTSAGVHDFQIDRPNCKVSY